LNIANQFSWMWGREPNDDGVWQWVVGPEAGIQFSNFATPTAPFNYANWGGIEPNNNPPGEDFAIFNIGTAFANGLIAPGGSGQIVYRMLGQTAQLSAI
jgi:hypothetical protein